MSQVFFGTKGQIQLGAIVGKGGEGSVYEIDGRADELAKIYHQPPDQQKLRALPSLRSGALATLAAWPTDVLSRRDGTVCGLVMPRVRDHQDIHHLYGPNSRVRKFPNADWRMLVRAAANTTRAFAAVHSVGAVIGDVNHGSVLVAQNATVRLIDCDSYQISSAGRHFFCKVGVPEFTPPELYGADYTRTVRTPNHDYFGLAVLIFQLLMMGRHPFAGKYSGTGDMPIEKAIPEFRYAYSEAHDVTQMRPPPGAPPVEAASGLVARLWHDAFSRKGATSGRPNTTQWIAALEALEKQLIRCSSVGSHFFHPAAGKCPWCNIEKQLPVQLFGSSSLYVPTTARSPQVTEPFNIAAIWAMVTSIAPPADIPAPTVPTVSAPSGRVQELVSARTVRRILGHLVGWGLFIGLTAWMPGGFLVWGFVAFMAGMVVHESATTAAVKREYQSTRDDMERRYNALIAQWQRECSAGAFNEKLKHFQALRTTYQSLPQKRTAKLDELVRNRRNVQLRQFLSTFDIDDARIPGIGSAKTAQLCSFGIETAADVEQYRVMNVPGFGPATTAKLMAWRQQVEARFRFDPNSAVDPNAIAKLDAEIFNEARKLEDELRQAPAVLRQLGTSIVSKRTALQLQINTVALQLAQARADAAAL